MNWAGNRGGSKKPFKVAKQVTIQGKRDAVQRRLAKRRKK